MGHLVVKDCYDEYDARTAKGWIYNASGIIRHTAKGWIYDARGTAHILKGWIYDASGITRHTAKGWLYDANIDDVAHVIIHNLIEAEDVRGCFDERAS